jgi:hypothetical protein
MVGRKKTIRRIESKPKDFSRRSAFTLSPWRQGQHRHSGRSGHRGSLNACLACRRIYISRQYECNFVELTVRRSRKTETTIELRETLVMSDSAGPWEICPKCALAKAIMLSPEDAACLPAFRRGSSIGGLRRA